MAIVSNAREDVAAALAPFRLQGQVCDLFAELPMLASVLSEPQARRPASAGKLPSLQPAQNASCSQASCQNEDEHRLDMQDLHMRAARVLMGCNAQAAGAKGPGLSKVGCECVICQEPLDENAAVHATLKTLPCGHTLHADCLKSWVKSSSRLARYTRCPVCRAQVRTDEILEECGKTLSPSASLPRLSVPASPQVNNSEAVTGHDPSASRRNASASRPNASALQASSPAAPSASTPRRRRSRSSAGCSGGLRRR